MNWGGNATDLAWLAAIAAAVAVVSAAVTTVAVLARSKRRARRAIRGMATAHLDGVLDPGELAPGTPGRQRFGDAARANCVYPDQDDEAWQDERRAGGGK
jgi:hypothetical protein